MSGRYWQNDLVAFAAAMLHGVGLRDDRARTVAEVLVEGDLLGHTTHGLALLPAYLEQIKKESMALDGEPEVVADRGSALTWDGRYLPGPWLVVRALDTAFARVGEHPVVTVVIRRSHHIACLAAYLKRATDRGMFCLLASSDPHYAFVAPHGGITPVYTPNPIAAGIPTDGDPILVDVSLSMASAGSIVRHHGSGTPLPCPCLIDNQGLPTNDAAAFYDDPPGAILPLGGLETGHKGFALGLVLEALTSALGAYGRADTPPHWGASVFLQLIDPNAFGGLDAFRRETGWLADACRASPVRPGDPPVRLPGEAALARRAEQCRKGVALFPGIMDALGPWSEELCVSPPEAVG